MNVYGIIIKNNFSRVFNFSGAIIWQRSTYCQHVKLTVTR